MESTLEAPGAIDGACKKKSHLVQNRLWSPPLWSFSLCFVVALGLCLLQPLADGGKQFCQDMSLSVDGYWYLAQARAWALDETVQTSGHYKKPIISALQFIFYSIFGVNYFSSKFLSIAAQMATMLVLAIGVGRSLGKPYALGACIVFALHPLAVTYARSPVIYPLVSFWVISALVLACGQRKWSLPAAIVWSIVGAWGVKNLVAVSLPGLLLVAVFQLLQSSRRSSTIQWLRWPLILGTLLLVGGALGPWSFPAFWGQILRYLGADQGGWGTQLLEFELRTRWFSAFPLLLPFALIGAWKNRTRWIEGEADLVALSGATLLFSMPLFVVAHYSPLRYMLFSLPLLMVLAAAGYHYFYASPRQENSGIKSPVYFVLKSLLIAGTALMATWSWFSYGKDTAIWGAAVAPILGIFAVLLCWRGFAKSPYRALAMVVSLTFVIQIPRLYTSIHQDSTVVRVGEQLATVLPEGAKMAGPFAHALTINSHIPARQMSSLHYGEGKLHRTLSEWGTTHLLFENKNEAGRMQAFAEDGAPLELVTRFLVRGETVSLLRVVNAQHPRSVFELGIAAEREQRYEKAEEYFQRVVVRSPNSAPSWEHLGRLALARRDVLRALDCFNSALKIDPARVSVRIALAELFFVAGDMEESSIQLQKVLQYMPNHRWARKKLRDIR